MDCKKAPGRWLVFTDLDGTLLGHADYDYEIAKPWLSRLEAEGIPLHIASSKTFAESSRYYREWGIHRPMVVENGAAIAWPLADGYDLKPVTTSYADLRAALMTIRERDGWPVEGFGDWSAARVAAETGLPSAQAELAKQRIATEPVRWRGRPEDIDRFRAALAKLDLRLLRGGRFLHIMGQADKATGVAQVKNWYTERDERTYRVLCLGDSENDRAMLEAADCSIVVQRHDGTHLDIAKTDFVHYSNAPSPQGWVESIENWLDS